MAARRRNHAGSSDSKAAADGMADDSALLSGPALQPATTGGALTECMDMSGKVVIITGANTGIGKETAALLYAKGATVVMACRDLQRAAAAKTEIEAELAAEARVQGFRGQLLPLQLDLTSLESVKTFATTFRGLSLPLHVLVNNAGLNSAGDNFHRRTADGYNLTFGVNYVGHFYLTMLLLPALKSSAPSRVVNLSSVTHRLGDGEFENSATVASGMNYSNSKLAMTMFTHALRRRLIAQGHSNVAVISVNPGAVRSDIWRTWPGWLRCVTRPIFYCLFLSPRQGAATSVAAAASPVLRGGEYLSPYRVLSWLPKVTDSLGPFAGARIAPSSPLSMNTALSEQLWDLSRRLARQFDPHCLPERE